MYISIDREGEKHSDVDILAKSVIYIDKILNAMSDDLPSDIDLDRFNAIHNTLAKLRKIANHLKKIFRNEPSIDTDSKGTQISLSNGHLIRG